MNTTIQDLRLELAAAKACRDVAVKRYCTLRAQVNRLADAEDKSPAHVARTEEIENGIRRLMLASTTRSHVDFNSSDLQPFSTLTPNHIGRHLRQLASKLKLRRVILNGFRKYRAYTKDFISES